MKRRIIILCTAWLAAALTEGFAADGRVQLCQSMMPIVITNSGSYVVTESLTGTKPTMSCWI